MMRLPAVALVVLSAAAQAQTPPLRLAIAGLEHGHVDGFLRAAKARADVQIAALWDPDPALLERYVSKYGLAGAVRSAQLAEVLDRAMPDAVAAFTSTWLHPEVVEACAARKIHVMMEKPLAVSMAHARRIETAAARGGIHVLVNYETTWYASHREIWKLLKEQNAAGAIRKMAAMDGHSGPKEIGVQPEFLAWLTDPVKNGAGALFDFGCYGANLFTWLMDNQRPVAVTAVTQQIKPAIYTQVDDEATVLVEYPGAQGIIQASWNWPFSRKDLEVYAERGYAIATGGNSVRLRLPGAAEVSRTPPPLPAAENDAISYLAAVVRGQMTPTGLSSLANNLIATEILDAARESARTGRRVVLGKAR